MDGREEGRGKRYIREPFVTSIPSLRRIAAWFWAPEGWALEGWLARGRYGGGRWKGKGKGGEKKEMVDRKRKMHTVDLSPP